MPAFSRLSTTLRSSLSDGGQNWDSIFNVIVGPASACGAALSDGGFGGQTCALGVDDPDDPTPAQIYVNRTASAQNAFLVVEGFFADAGGPFTLTSDVVPLLAGDLCENAVALTSLPASRPADTLVGYFSNYAGGAGCGVGTTSLDRVYRVSVPTNNRLTATVTASTNSDGGVAFAPTLNIVQGTTCAASVTCVAGGSSSATPGTATATFDNVGAAADFLVIVDTSTSTPGGTFSLNVSTTPITLTAGDVCGNVTAATTTPQTFQNETFTDFQNQYTAQGQTSCAYLPGIDRAYAVTIPPGQILTAVATPTDAGVLPDGGFLNLSLQVLAAATECSVGPCLSSANLAGPAAETVTRSNVLGNAAESVLLVVDSNVATPLGTYSLAINFAAPPAGDICGTPLPLSLATTTPRDLTGFGNDYSTFTSGCSFKSGRDVVYSISAPPMQRLTITVVSTGTDCSISLVSNAAACGTSCLAFNDTGGTGGTDTLVYDNTTASAQNLLVIVDSTSLQGTASFTVSATAAALPMTLNPGETCAVPAQLTAGTTASGSLVGLANDLRFSDVNACQGVNPGGPDGVYSVSVPDNQRLTAVLTPTFPATLNAVVGGAANCGTTGADGGTQGIVCAAGSDAFGNGAETINYTNGTGVPQNVLLLIDSESATVGTFDLTTTVAPFLTGEICSDSLTAVTASVTTSETLVGYGNDYSGFLASCALANAEDRVYRITVPPNFRLTATTTSAADLGLSIVDGPASNCGPITGCLARADATFSGTTAMPVNETITFDNASSTARTVFLVVDRFGTTGGTPTFQLAINLATAPAPAYVKTTVPQACDTLTAAATALTAAVGDDAATTFAALPFPFSFYGSPVSTYSVSSNGLLGFSTMPSGTVGSNGGGSIPNALTPNNMAAVFWDDLNVTGTSAARAEVFGPAGSRRFVVEWSDYGFWASGPSGVGLERLTFQAKIFEGTNVVEFHYCTLAANGGSATEVTGQFATIGVENATGTEAIVHSQAMSNSVNTTDAIRFTP
ncbi:MAG: hypothetical protein INH41_19415 [Myxococcaceae bacterium]|nr:hypothetical protein [Myxococcaceae bacterium]